MLKRFCLFLALAVCSLSTVFPVSAESGDVVISVNPSEQDIELKPGRRYTHSITVYNLGRLGFDFEVDVTPYQSSGEDYQPDYTTVNNYTKLSNWITFSESKFHVEPNKAQVVDFEIAVPDDATGGGQYAAVIVRVVNTGESDSAVQFVSQIAALVYGHVTGAEAIESGDMIAHTLPSVVLDDIFKTSSTFENTGTIDYKVTQTLTIRNFFTNREIITPTTVNDDNYPIGTSTSTVLPGTKRTIDMVWGSSPQLGLFRVNQTISYLTEELSYDTVVFICPIWLIVLFVAFIVLMIVWIIARIRARRYDQPQVF